MAKTITTGSAADRTQTEVEKLISSGDVEAAVQTLRDGLKATIVCRVTEPDGKRFAYREVPDWRTAVTSAKLLIEFGRGRARQQIQVSGTVGHVHTSEAELLAAARGLRMERAAQIVDQYAGASVDLLESGNQAKTVEVVEEEVIEEEVPEKLLSVDQEPKPSK